MKIQVKKLTTFLDKAFMSGTQRITEALLSFDADGLHIIADSATKYARTVSWMKPAAFTSYEAIGKVGMNDLDKFMTVLGRFKKEIEITKIGTNLLQIKEDNKIVDIEMMDERFFGEQKPNPNLEFAEKFSIDAKSLQNIFSDVRVNKDAVLIIKTEPSRIIFMNTGKYKFKTDVFVDGLKGGNEVRFGDAFLSATDNLTDMLEISITTNYPAKIEEKTAETEAEQRVAQEVEQEAPVEEAEAEEAKTEENGSEETEEGETAQ